jgi:hypothetical protein
MFSTSKLEDRDRIHVRFTDENDIFLKEFKTIEDKRD